ncbi:hypothetical protein DERP_006080 [Dermatophagoides pteronyssinus]|uniref:Uncharacterized protein n=1 Tax=Dermatophagoides pteronyssinus TaxID=6956 RepID=A0ABQ8JT76_DERPT|nr:hypothetical protein DERP_006080 [Dermatophagoides pteronyssinus]
MTVSIINRSGIITLAKPKLFDNDVCRLFHGFINGFNNNCGCCCLSIRLIFSNNVVGLRVVVVVDVVVVVVEIGKSIFCIVVCFLDSITSGIVKSIFIIGLLVVVDVVDVVVDVVDVIGDDTTFFFNIKRCDFMVGKPNRLRSTLLIVFNDFKPLFDD